jgi:hypothetical protein
MATPFITAAAALLKSYRPNLSTQELKAAILRCVDRLPGLKGKVLTGGRLNLFKVYQNMHVSGSIPVPGKIYKIKNVKSQKYLQVKGSSEEEGCDVEQMQSTDDKNQQWRVDMRNRYYSLTAMHSGKCLEISRLNGMSDGTAAQQGQYYKGDEQLWSMEISANNLYFNLINKRSE